jgi:type IV secretion system protein VirD4
MRWFHTENWVVRLERFSYCSVWLTVILLGALAILYWPYLGLLLLIVLAFKWFQHSRRTDSVTFGSARWADHKTLQSAGCLLQTTGLVLGRMIIQPRVSVFSALWALFCYSSARAHEAVNMVKAFYGGRQDPIVRVPDSGPPHLAVYGASGSGKSWCYAIPTAAENPHSMVIIDPKAEIYRQTARYRAGKLGHEIVVIDPFGIAAPVGKRAKLNPLSLYRSDPATIMDNSRRLANALIVRPKDEKDPFWNSGAQVTLQTVLAFLMAKARPEEATLNRLRDLTTNPKLLRELLEYLEQSDDCNGLLRRLAGTMRWYQGQTEASIYSVANTHLEFLDSIPLMETLSATTFDPKKLIDGRMTIYLCLPVDRMYELLRLQRILLTSLINLMFHSGESRERRVHFLLDEAASLGEIDALYNALVFGRSYGMRLTFFYQSAGQVQQCFPESKATDFRATTASVYCGVNDFATAQEVSQWIGSTTVESQSWQSSTNSGGSMSQGIQEQSHGTNWGSSESYTRTEVGRALIQPEEILQLPKSAAIALLPNVPPILVEKQPFYQRRRTTTAGWRLMESLGRVTMAMTLFLAGITIIDGIRMGDMGASIRLTIRAVQSVLNLREELQAKQRNSNST